MKSDLQLLTQLTDELLQAEIMAGASFGDAAELQVWETEINLKHKEIAIVRNRLLSNICAKPSEHCDECAPEFDCWPDAYCCRKRPLARTYPDDWKAIAKRIKDAAGWKCERCKHPHEVETGYVLTVHHLDGDKAHCADWNLAALCQRCYLHIQYKVNMRQMFFEDILDVSEWFKPHLDGYRRSLCESQVTMVVVEP